MTRSWNQVRSEFNHAWLKNRVLITLCRAQNVLAGVVEDESIWEDLGSLLTEWQERRCDAEQIIAVFSDEASPAREIRHSILSDLDPDMREWLGQLAEQRWKEFERPDSRVSRAITALRAFDREVRAFSSVVEAARKGKEIVSSKTCLVTLQSATKELAEAFSKLAPAGV